MNFPERLVVAMKARNKKQVDISKDLNISSGGISMLVAGKREPSEPMLRMLSGYLNINYVWLKTGEGDMEPIPVEDDTPGLLMARYRKGSPSVRQLLRAFAELDDDWYQKLDDAIRRAQEEYDEEENGSSE